VVGRVVVGRVVVVAGCTTARGGTVGCGSGDPLAMVDPLSSPSRPESSVSGESCTTSCTNDGVSPPARYTLLPTVTAALSEIARGNFPAKRNLGVDANGSKRQMK